MPHLPRWRRYFRVMPPADDLRVDEEIRFHFETRIDELVGEGLSERDARIQAVGEFGDVDRVRATLRTIDARTRRERRRAEWLQGLGQDIRVSCRSARRAPAFSLMVIVTFALGIGANTVIFSFLSGVLLRPLPYADPGELVTVWLQNSALGQDQSPLASQEVLQLRAATAGLAAIEGLQSNIVPTNLTISGVAVPIQAALVSPGMFDLLGRSAQLGRTFHAVDEGIVLSYAFWQRQFGGDPNVIGRIVGGWSGPTPIAGVMPPDFVFPFGPLVAGPVTFTDSVAVDAWIPIELARANETFRNMTVIARPRAGVSVSTMGAGIAQAVDRLAGQFPETLGGWRAVVVPMHEQVVGDVRPALRLLFAGVGLMLLVASANVANLLLARAAARQRELSMRAALGAGRLRLVRQTLVESLMLALAGGVAGLLVARWATSVLVSLAPAEIPRLQSVSVDWRVLGFTAAVTIATGVAVGLVPTLASASADLRQLLADGGRGATAGRRTRMRGVLVGAEVALAVVLAIGGALLARSFAAVLAVDPGFTSDHLLTMNVTLPSRYDTPDRRRELYRQLFERLESIPGVVSAGGTTRLPLGGANSTTRITADDGGELDEARWPAADLRRALHDYFDTMQIPIRRGRAFDERDGPDGQAVAILNETLATRLFPGQEPLGQRIRLGANAGIRVATVIGIAGDIRHRSLEAPPAPEVYIHALQHPPVAPFIVVRTAGDPSALATAIRSAVLELEPALTFSSLRTMNELRQDTVAARGFLTWLIAAFGILALVLAVIGVYGLVALMVVERRPEIGIRLALGARPAGIGRLVLSDALRFAATGSALGLLLTVPLKPLLASQLYGIAPTDPLTMAAVPLLMLGATAMAAFIPARRAMHADPVATMRAD